MPREGSAAVLPFAGLMVGLLLRGGVFALVTIGVVVVPDVRLPEAAGADVQAAVSRSGTLAAAKKPHRLFRRASLATFYILACS
jgi:hypothetical protein